MGGKISFLKEEEAVIQYIIIYYIYIYYNNINSLFVWPREFGDHFAMSHDAHLDSCLGLLKDTDAK